MELNSDKVKIKDFLDWKRGGILSVNPEYQRGAVWKEDQQKKLVDSVLRGYPLPLIYLHHKKRVVGGIPKEDFEIIDGQQRLNALYIFGENALTLFDPQKDDKVARFPKFIKDKPCAWARCDYHSLSVDLREKFDNTELFIVKVTTDNEDEARDLFIRLQAGLPLNAQEKRDAWPGGYTEFALKYGGKRELVKFPGHEFFRKWIINPSTDRGEIRTLCAQIGMLFFEEATKGNWMSIGTKPIDDYYYQNLSFDIYSDKVMEFGKVLHLAAELFDGYKGPKLKVHEAIHIILLIDSLLEDYTVSWQANFITAFDLFRHNAAKDKKIKAGDYWYKYGTLTMTQAANANTLQARHNFFSQKMQEVLQPVQKDQTRIYGQLEREILYFQYKKRCVVCDTEINWYDLEIHHLQEHQHGGETSLDNGVPVHKLCHPKGQAAIDFYVKWKETQELLAEAENSDTEIFTTIESGRYKIENESKGINAHGVFTDTQKFCILKGSTISRFVSDGFEQNAKAAAVRRINLINDGSINTDFVFTRDVLFNSKSNAASLVLGVSANGNTSWLPE